MKNLCFVVLLLLHTHEKCQPAKIYDHPTPLSQSPSPRALPAHSSAIATNMAGMAQLETLDVKCGRTAMNVELKFTSAFPGVVYSKGHFSDPACVYVKEATRRANVFRFTIPLDGCGTAAEEGLGEPGQDRTVGNTIILQNDPIIQEVWDEARHITCTWSHSLTKSVAFLPIKVYEPETIDVQLDARSVNTLMEIQRGRRGAGGPLNDPPTGYVHVGDDISVVMYVKGAKMDANVVSCNATTAGRSATVALVDQQGCLLRPDLLTPFAKTRKVNGVEADLMLYSYLKAFNIAESPEFIISCELEICEDNCPPITCINAAANKKRRRRRSQEEVVEVLEEEVEEVVYSSSSSSSSSSPRRVIMERGVMVLSSREKERARCLFRSSEALLSMGLLMTLVSCLAVLCAVLGHKLWTLKTQMRKNGLCDASK